MLKRRVTLVVVSGLLVLVFFSVPQWMSSSPRSSLMQLFSPLVRLENGMLKSVSGVRNAWVSRRSLARENSALRKRVVELDHENLRLRHLRQENDRLRRLLSFSSARAQERIPAQVIGRDTRHWYSSIIIDRGSNDGIAPRMAVVSDEGLVGKIIEVGPSVSKVLLIVDKRSRVGGMVQRTRETGIVNGTSFHTCRLSYLPRQAEADAGDRIVTSGLGGIYPKDLYVGEITRVYKGEYDLYRYADVSPGVNFSKIEEVLVLVGQVNVREDALLR